jgi:signal transduction histidine kinase
VAHSVPVAAVEVVLVAAAYVGNDNRQPDTLVGNLVVVAAAWIVGDGVRRRREDAVSEQARLARQAVADERLRIARELHDEVAHSMSVIAVQAGTGRMVIDDDPDHAVEGGTPVDVQVDGDRRTVPPGVDVAAYRVVQEALTNVRRHTPGARARIHVSFEPEQVVVLGRPRTGYPGSDGWALNAGRGRAVSRRRGPRGACSGGR